jgi:hypothetical protein
VTLSEDDEATRVVSKTADPVDEATRIVAKPAKNQPLDDEATTISRGSPIDEETSIRQGAAADLDDRTVVRGSAELDDRTVVRGADEPEDRTVIRGAADFDDRTMVSPGRSVDLDDATQIRPGGTAATGSDAATVVAGKGPRRGPRSGSATAPGRLSGGRIAYVPEGIIERTPVRNKAPKTNDIIRTVIAAPAGVTRRSRNTVAIDASVRKQANRRGIGVIVAIGVVTLVTIASLAGIVLILLVV